MASSSASPPNNSQSPNAPTDGIIQALGNAFKSQTGGVLNNVQIAKLLQANIGQLGQLAKDGKLSQQQILQVKSILIVFEFRILIICVSKVEGIC
jgi:transcription initiation factor TFIID subunit 12